jgi:hypothetical protein
VILQEACERGLLMAVDNLANLKIIIKSKGKTIFATGRGGP